MGLYYLSFQRPPPVKLAPNEAVRVCVNVTNDLRSEPYLPPAGAPLRLRLCWVDGKMRPIGGGPVAEHTWTDAGSAYKVVDGLKAPGFLPGRVDTVHLAVSVLPAARTNRSSAPAAGPSVSPLRPGRISIVPTQQQQQQQQKQGSRDTDVDDSYIFRLHGHAGEEEEEDQEGLEFVPVLSGPIRVARSSGDFGKQNELLRIIRIEHQNLPTAPPPVDVVILEQTGFDLDKHIWDASIHLLRLLTSSARSLPASLRFLERARDKVQASGQSFSIVELGAGTGIVSVVLAKWLSSQIQFESQAQVPLDGGDGDMEAHTTAALQIPLFSFFATDLESALPIMNTNLDLNDCGPRSLSATDNHRSVGSDQIRFNSPLHLDWTDASLPLELAQSAPDVVLISDCTYNPTFYQPLAQTISRLSPRCSCILAKKHRHEDEKSLWAIFIQEDRSRGVHGTTDRWVLVKGQAQEDEDARSSEDCGWAIWERRSMSSN